MSGVGLEGQAMAARSTPADRLGERIATAAHAAYTRIARQAAPAFPAEWTVMAAVVLQKRTDDRECEGDVVGLPTAGEWMHGCIGRCMPIACSCFAPDCTGQTHTLIGRHRTLITCSSLTHSHTTHTCTHTHTTH